MFYSELEYIIIKLNVSVDRSRRDAVINGSH